MDFRNSYPEPESWKKIRDFTVALVRRAGRYDLVQSRSLRLLSAGVHA